MKKGKKKKLSLRRKLEALQPRKGQKRPRNAPKVETILKIYKAKRKG